MYYFIKKYLIKFYLYLFNLYKNLIIILYIYLLICLFNEI